MKRNVLLATIATAAIAVSGPALTKPGGGNSGVGGGISNTGSTMRDLGRQNSKGADNASDKAIERASSNSALMSTVTGTRVREQSNTKTRATGSARVGASASASTKLTGVSTGMTVVDSGGATVGTVTGVTTKGNGSIRTVQVTLSNGQIVTLAPNSLTLDGDVLTTTSLATNVKSQGALHANINALRNASPNSALASAGVTSLTGLATGLTVENSGGTSIGTINEILTNRAGAVVGVRVDLTAGGSVILPATSLSMDGTTVVTSSTQF